MADADGSMATSLLHATLPKKSSKKAWTPGPLLLSESTYPPLPHMWGCCKTA